MRSVVFLFDMDGVLVQPGGYRAAVRATVNHFTRKLGLGDLAPADETVAIFEAQGITCEWDMVPLLIALAMDQAASQLARPVCWDSYEAACVDLMQAPQAGLTVDFAQLLRDLGQYVCPGETPSETVLRASREGRVDGPLRHIAGQGVLEELLSNTRRLEFSRTSHVFETFALGHRYYQQATGLETEVETEALLAAHDRPLLLPGTRDLLRALGAQKRLGMAAYTARPSRPVRDASELLALYAPEAEMGLEVVGWPDLPLVGSGQTGEAARQIGEHEERLIKPAPYHALAALAAACLGDRRAALDWMLQVFHHFERGEAPPDLRTSAGPLPQAVDLHIFEDSPAGMRGGQAAADLLRQLGMQVRLDLSGITTHPEKAGALESAGARIFPDINAAVQEALTQAGLV